MWPFRVDFGTIFVDEVSSADFPWVSSVGATTAKQEEKLSRVGESDIVFRSF